MKGRNTHTRLARLEAHQATQAIARGSHGARERLAAKLWSMVERMQGADSTAGMSPMQQVACMLWHDPTAVRERLKELATAAQHRGGRYGA